MSRRNVQLILLCEDTQQECFLRRFLEKSGWSTRRMRILKGSPGQGSGEQYVREQFPRELAAHRARSAQVGQALVVMMDGDNDGPDARLKAMNEECRKVRINVRTPQERVAVFIPTWCIETWLAYLEGQTVDETRSNYPRLERELDCRRRVGSLWEMCRQGALRAPAPASLEIACDEFRRLEDVRVSS